MLKNTSSCLTVDQANALIAQWDGRCAYCEQPLRRACMEHVEPLSRGGEDVPANIVPACRSCNSAKHDLFLLEWVFYREGLLRQDHETRQPYVVEADAPRDRPASGTRYFDAPLRKIRAVSCETETLECGHRVAIRQQDGARRAIRRRRCYACLGHWPARLRGGLPYSTVGG